MTILNHPISPLRQRLIDDMALRKLAPKMQSGYIRAIKNAVSYRDFEEIMAERGVSVDHSSLNRWVVRYAPQVASEAKKRKRPVAGSRRMDETYLRVKGEWAYLYRAIDKFGNTVDFMLSDKRDEAAATAFFRQAIDGNGLPEKVAIDKSGSNNAGLETSIYC